MIQRFVKRPLVIEAVRWSGSADIANAFIGDRFAVDWEYDIGFDRAIIIPTLEGRMRCEVGDWIIRGIRGEFYPCKHDIFERSYEPTDLPRSTPEDFAVGPAGRTS